MPQHLDSWAITRHSAPKEWETEQHRLATLCVQEDRLSSWSLDEYGNISGLERVAGVDVSLFPDQEHAAVAVVVLSYPELEVVYERCVTVKLCIPYIPGFLAFREAPSCAALLMGLPEDVRPQAILVDGNGAYHPRQCGCATHVGISVGIPTVGVAKKVMHVGDINMKAAWKLSQKLKKAGDAVPLVVKAGDDRPLAMLLRPCTKSAATLVVSVGHLISLSTAVNLAASVCRHTVAEPIRLADRASRAAVERWLNGIPLAEMLIKEVGMKRKRGESSVLPVISKLLAKQQAEDDVDARISQEPAHRPRRGGRQAHQQAQKWVAVRGDQLLRVPGVDVIVPDGKHGVRMLTKQGKRLSVDAILNGKVEDEALAQEAEAGEATATVRAGTTLNMQNGKRRGWVPKEQQAPQAAVELADVQGVTCEQEETTHGFFASILGAYCRCFQRN
jgi:deoxyinosine 3'endonuclease (endonuclease V)